MSTPQIETKIERAVESFEALALAIVANATAIDSKARATTFEDVQDAREECKGAIRAVLEPTLRVIT